MIPCPSGKALSSSMYSPSIEKYIYYNISRKKIMETMTKMTKLHLCVLELLL